MKCKQCSRKVKETFTAKWQHIAKYHPQVMMKHLLPILSNEGEAERVGAELAKGLLRKISL